MCCSRGSRQIQFKDRTVFHLQDICCFLLRKGLVCSRDQTTSINGRGWESSRVELRLLGLGFVVGFRRGSGIQVTNLSPEFPPLLARLAPSCYQYQNFACCENIFPLVICAPGTLRGIGAIGAKLVDLLGASDRSKSVNYALWQMHFSIPCWSSFSTSRPAEAETPFTGVLVCPT